jgi:hypothetical protein
VDHTRGRDGLKSLPSAFGTIGCPERNHQCARMSMGEYVRHSRTESARFVVQEGNDDDNSA